MIGGVEDDHPEPQVDQLTAKVWKSANPAIRLSAFSSRQRDGFLPLVGCSRRTSALICLESADLRTSPCPHRVSRGPNRSRFSAQACAIFTQSNHPAQRCNLRVEFRDVPRRLTEWDVRAKGYCFFRSLVDQH